MSVMHVKDDGGADLFDFGGKLGDVGFTYVKEQVEEHGGQVIEGGPESRVIVTKDLDPNDIWWISRITLPHLVKQVLAL